MTKSKKVLGRGLESLIPDVGKKDTYKYVDIHKISKNKYQPRKDFKKNQNFINLVASIKEKGVVEPLILKTEANGKYSIIAGERRYRAALEAGLTKVPAVIRNNIDTDEELLELALIENIHREDLNAIEAAKAYDILLKKFSYTHEQMAEKLSISRVAITNKLRLLSLPEQIMKLIINEQLTEGHARVLLGLKEEKLINSTAKQVILNHLSVRQTEKLVKEIISNNDNKKITKKTDPNILEISQKISYLLNSKVDIKGDTKKGKIIIYYKDSQQLDEIIKYLRKEEKLED